MEGEKAFGKDIILLKQDDDLSAQTHWHQKGYEVTTFLPGKEYKLFYNGVDALFKGFLENAGIAIVEDFSLSNYHRYIADDYETHLAVVNQAKLLQVADFPIDVKQVEERVSALCQTPMQALNPIDGEKVFHFRIVRPQRNDNNPLHRDVWLEDYQDCINIYVPICGSNHLSSLSLIPASHYWSEALIEKTKSGAKVNGVQFNVPALTDSKIPLNIIRPNPALNEVLIFSPYLLHGGATNLNDDITRISLEMRFWRKKN